jgi:hypothetical protein
MNQLDYVTKLVLIDLGYGLDRFINDEDDFIRYKAAQQGYGLDKLINDKSWNVRNAAYTKIEEEKKNGQRNK